MTTKNEDAVRSLLKVGPFAGPHDENEARHYNDGVKAAAAAISKPEDCVVTVTDEMVRERYPFVGRLLMPIYREKLRAELAIATLSQQREAGAVAWGVVVNGTLHGAFLRDIDAESEAEVYGTGIAVEIRPLIYGDTPAHAASQQPEFGHIAQALRDYADGKTGEYLPASLREWAGQVEAMEGRAVTVAASQEGEKEWPPMDGARTPNEFFNPAHPAADKVLVPRRLTAPMARVLTAMLTHCRTVEESYADLLAAALSPPANGESDGR